ncbi:unnamed protein product [Victoria cruziana]
MKTMKLPIKLLPLVRHTPSLSCASSCSQSTMQITDIDEVCRLISDHPFPDEPLEPALHQIGMPVSSSFINDILGRLFAGHADGFKTLQLFNFARRHSDFRLSSDLIEKMVHILSRMREFDKVWDLFDEIHVKHPSMISLKSMSIVLARYCQHRPFEETLEAFSKMERYVGEHTVDTYNVLLYAFCTQKHMMEARAVFRKIYRLFMPNTQTLNILLMGFKESRNLTAVELFYHDLIRRGCVPNTVTYNIRIDSFCKKGRVHDALRLFREMEENHCSPTIETYTTLIHGFCITRDPVRARQIFDEMVNHDLKHDSVAYNALISCYVRVGDLKSAVDLMDEMEGKGVMHDDVTYNTLFRGLKTLGSIGALSKLYHKMIEKDFLPKMQTVILLMKCFCQNDQCDLGIELWDYLIRKGCCPHAHVLDLLVTSLCSRGKIDKAFECLYEALARGRRPNKQTFQVLLGYLQEAGDGERLIVLKEIMRKLEISA